MSARDVIVMSDHAPGTARARQRATRSGPPAPWKRVRAGCRPSKASDSEVEAEKKDRDGAGRGGAPAAGAGRAYRIMVQ